MTRWTVSAPLFTPQTAWDSIAVKDPSIVYAEGAWHLFYTAISPSATLTGYASAPTLEGLRTAQHHELPMVRSTAERYGCAPQVFYYAPQGLWYLLFQNRDANYMPCYCTTATIADPASWSEFRPLLPKDESAKWIDFWVIADETRVYLFYTRAHHDVVYRTTSLADFPNGWGDWQVAYSGVHEAVHIYKAQSSGAYHMVYECNAGASATGERSFGLAVADELAGSWRKETDAYAVGSQLVYPEGVSVWTREVSHGEALRLGCDQHMEYDDTHPRWLIQGLLREQQTEDYVDLPWILGLIERE